MWWGVGMCGAPLNVLGMCVRGDAGAEPRVARRDMVAAVAMSMVSMGSCHVVSILLPMSVVCRLELRFAVLATPVEIGSHRLD
jgi:hypothetical protein